MEPVRTIRLTSFERPPEFEASRHEFREGPARTRQRRWRQRRRRRRRPSGGAPRGRLEESLQEVEREVEEIEQDEQVELPVEAAPRNKTIAMNIHHEFALAAPSGAHKNSKLPLRRLQLAVLVACLLVASSQLTTSHCDQNTSRAHANGGVRHDRNNQLRPAAAAATSQQRPHRRSVVAEQAAGGEGHSKPANSSKVMALATKLDHWLQCHRMNLLAAYRRQLAESGQSDGQQQQHQPRQQQRQQRHERHSGPAAQAPSGAGDQNGTTSKLAEPPVATCAAHFDGHLCWPEARAGQEVRLACPQINMLYSPEAANLSGSMAAGGAQAAHNHNENETNRPVKTVIANQRDNINQTQEITTAATKGGPQSIRPIGIGPIPINQSEAISQLLAGDSNPIESARTMPERSGQRARFARRVCEQPQAKAGDAKWQPAADYADCGHLFDPTDRWLQLGDYKDEQPHNSNNNNNNNNHYDDDGRNRPAHHGQDNRDRELFESLSQQLERIDPRIEPYSEALDQWIHCIGQIIEERERLAGEPARRRPESSNDNASSTSNATAGECPIIFDGWRCWPATKAGGTAYLNCPMRPGFSTKRKAFKICTPQADWARHPDSNRYWSNYTTCVDTVDLAFRTKIININVIGYLMSLVALAVSLMIFVVFKNLRCTRVTIHKNLFVSFIVNNSMWIVWNTYIISNPQVLESNPLGCRLWHVLVHYFLMSNYFWMFCEGLYLHTLLVVTFIKEDKILKWFYLLGWLTPIPIIVAYAYERSADENYAKFCWIDQSPHDVIFQAPIVTSLVLNLIFLINIVRVLVMKLRANNAQDTHQTRKAARATLILIPLLGLNYILTPFRPEPESEWHSYYEVVAAVCTSLQGLCVAILFCFYNGEVTNTIKKRLKDSFLFNRESKRTMRSRSNTAMSNIFNTNNANNNNNNNETSPPAGNSRCAPDFRPPISSSSWSSSSGANLMAANANQRRQQLLVNNLKPNGRQSFGPDKLTEPNLEPADRSPLIQAAEPALVIETKLAVATGKQQRQRQQMPEVDEENLNLLTPSESLSNNNNNLTASN